MVPVSTISLAKDGNWWVALLSPTTIQRTQWLNFFRNRADESITLTFSNLPLPIRGLSSYCSRRWTDSRIKSKEERSSCLRRYCRCLNVCEMQFTILIPFFSYLKVEAGDDVSSTTIPVIIHHERSQFGSSSLWIKERLGEEGLYYFCNIDSGWWW